MHGLKNRIVVACAVSAAALSAAVINVNPGDSLVAARDAARALTVAQRSTGV